MTSSEDNLVGQTVLDRYRIVRRLASGGMGVVYLARSEGAAGFVKPVVIKRVLSHLMEDDSIMQLFVREAHILANLQHPGIVDVIDFAESDGAYLMALEYVHGYHLGKWLKYLRRIDQQLSVELALHITVSVLRALHYAHTRARPDGSLQGIIHRDVSPANVLLDAEGHIKLTDFGIARMQAAPGEQQTVGSRLKGKFQYMAPELFDGDAPSPQTDVFSVAIMLHELLVGRNEFLSKEMGQTVARVLEHEPTPLRTLRSDIPDGFDAVLQRGLAKKPAQRYRDASSFARDLRQLAELSEDEAGARLAECVHQDFHGEMPARMGLEPLDVLERAWRSEPHEIDPDAASARGPEAETRVGLRSRSGDTTDESPARGGSDSTPSDNDIPIVEAAATQTSPQTPSERQSWWAPRRIAWLAAAAGLVVVGGAAAVLALTQGSEASGSQEEPRYIVVDRQSGAGSTKEASGEEGASGEEPEPGSGAAQASLGPLKADEASGDAGTTQQDKGSDQRGRGSGDEPSPERPRDDRPARDDEPAAQADPGQRRSAQLTRAFAQRRDRVQKCFATHADKLEGSPRVTIRFRVSASGRVRSAKLQPDSLSGTALGGCLLRVARQTEFGPGEKPVSFRIPITVRQTK